MSQDNKKYAYGGLVRKDKIGKEAFKREYGQSCDPSQLIHSDDPNSDPPDLPPYDPFKWGRMMEQEEKKQHESRRLDKIEESLERIERKVDKLIGPQLIKGIWR